MEKVTLEPLRHRKEWQIAVKFKYNLALKDHVFSLKGVKWSRTHRCFYLPFSLENKNRLFTHLRSGGYFVDYSELTGFNPKENSVLELDNKFSPAQKRMLDEYVSYLKGQRLSESSVRT